MLVIYVCLDRILKVIWLVFVWIKLGVDSFKSSLHSSVKVKLMLSMLSSNHTFQH